MKRSRTAVICALLVLVTLSVPVSCGDTAGRIVSIEWAVHGVPEEGLPVGEVVTDLGWHVRLEEAWLSLGPMYAHAADEGLLAHRLERLLAPPRALAHAGHDHGFDRVRAEWLEQTAVDVLAPAPRSLGWTTAEAGAVDRLEVLLRPHGLAEGPEALRGAALYVRGEAERDDIRIPFHGTLRIDAEGAQQVDNIEANALLDEGGRLTVGIRHARWFEGAQFDRLEADGSEPVAIVAGTQVHNALYLGVRNPRAFVVDWTPSEEDGGLE
jgi:hypothetical protein